MAKNYPSVATPSGKVWNEKLGYEMDEKLNDNMDKAVLKYQKASGIKEELEEEKDKDIRFPVFDSVFFDAFEAAKEEYVEDGKPLDKVIKDYVEWLEACLGKEDKLKEIAEDEDDEDDEGEDEEEDE